MDLPRTFIPRLASGPVALEEVCASLLASPPCGGLSDFDKEALSVLGHLPFSVIGYINRNSTNGFAVYALYGDAGVILAMRGSESGACSSSLVDWTDNFAAPFFGSIQYRDACSIVNRYPTGPLLITGHSKGGNNALCALAAARNPDARAIVFNAQGFARRQLSDVARNRLKETAVNCVTQKDIVGALAWHPEKRFFCAARPGTHPHSLESFLWLADGSPAPARRSSLSYAAELFSRLAISGLHTLQSGATIHIKDSAAECNTYIPAIKP